MLLDAENSLTGNYTSKLFSFEDFDLSSVKITQEGLQLFGTPIDTFQSHVRLYYTTVSAFVHAAVRGRVVTLEFFANAFLFFLKETGTDRHLRDRTKIYRCADGRRIFFQTNLSIKLLESYLRLNFDLPM